MANVSEFSIVTYPAQTGVLARGPKARTVIRRDTVLSVVTPDDFASEAEAQLVAEKLIRKL